ncbi:MAG: hypothetical protein Q4G58_11815 [bacterium]|nr:hypothetical protein [bacterium]
MGKIILCTGRMTQTPYVFNMSNTGVYSIEEMSYYLYTHIYEISEDFLDQDLVNWIRFEVALPELAEKLEVLKRNGNGIKDIVVTILCSNDYYSEKEIKELVIIMDAIKGLPAIKRKKIRGDYYLKYKMYHYAAMEYENILKDKEAADFTPEEYGDLIHNIGVVKVQTSSYKAAAGCFKEAYNLNHREASLTQYMLAILLSGDQEKYNEELEKYELSEEFTSMLYQAISEKEQEAKTTHLCEQMEDMKQMIKSGNREQYEHRLNHIVYQLKQTYRKHLEG